MVLSGSSVSDKLSDFDGYSLPKLLDGSCGLVVAEHCSEVQFQQPVLRYVLRSLEAGFCIPPSL